MVLMAELIALNVKMKHGWSAERIIIQVKKYKSMTTKKTDIWDVCSPCGLTANYLTCLKKYGKPPIKKAYDVSTYHTGTCDVCGEKTSVTEPRDFFYPDFNLILKKIKV